MARVLSTVPQSQVIVSWNSAQREEHTGMTQAEERSSRGDPEENRSVLALEIKSQVPGVGVTVSLWRVNSTEETQDQGGPGPKTTRNQPTLPGSLAERATVPHSGALSQGSHGLALTGDGGRGAAWSWAE